MHITIYGVYEGERCVMVGSTSQTLEARRKDYRRASHGYDWFRPEIHEHRAIWEGDIPDCDAEQARFIRAAKELMWIARMGTWYPHGWNRSNPVIQAIGMPWNYAELKRLGSAKGGRRLHQLHPRLASETLRRTRATYPEVFARASRNGALAQDRESKARGGRKGGPSGGRKFHQLYPELARENGLKMHRLYPDLCRVNCANGGRAAWAKDPEKMRKLARWGWLFGLHRRWHVNRNKPNPLCPFCSTPDEPNNAHH